MAEERPQSFDRSTHLWPIDCRPAAGLSTVAIEMRLDGSEVAWFSLFGRTVTRALAIWSEIAHLERSERTGGLTKSPEFQKVATKVAALRLGDEEMVRLLGNGSTRNSQKKTATPPGRSQRQSRSGPISIRKIRTSLGREEGINLRGSLSGSRVGSQSRISGRTDVVSCSKC